VGQKDSTHLRIDKALARRALFPDRDYTEFDVSDREIHASRRLTELLAKQHRLYAENGDPGGGWPELLHDLLAAARDLGFAEGWRQRGHVAFVELEALDEYASLKRGTGGRKNDSGGGPNTDRKRGDS